jgi:hypothetical protein
MLRLGWLLEAKRGCGGRRRLKHSLCATVQTALLLLLLLLLLLVLLVLVLLLLLKCLPIV